ncbi:polymorphic toxin type 24 domain-containing protein [Streptomyces sp. NPDC048483]|uniref:polymorphic toxin type 24 domain-containing protein n=1 Tax=Streptomyces sp. NPDC048483 TaxID=3154927 RepID=UPI0034173A56
MAKPATPSVIVSMGNVESAGHTAVTLVKKATESAPERPGFWPEVGDFFSDVGEGPVDGGMTVLTDLASFGNAMIQHPGDSVALLGGIALPGSAPAVKGSALPWTPQASVLSLEYRSTLSPLPGLPRASAWQVPAPRTLPGTPQATPRSNLYRGTAKGVASAAPNSGKRPSSLITVSSTKGHRWSRSEQSASGGRSENGTLYKANPESGKVSNYTTYDSEGRPLKRVNLEGDSHGGVETAHVVEYMHNPHPKTGEIFVRPSRKARAAFPWEIP